ncbi:MAG: hypothetical protein QXU30_07300 [Sulfolobales archaeon]
MSDQYFLLRLPVDEFLSKYPYFYNKIYTDIRFMKDLITEYTYVVSTTISIKYSSQEWTDETCIREFIQNAMDASEEATGEPKVFINVFREHGVTEISDLGHGVTEKAILMGGSEKPCWSRGRFGEGMKMSMIYLLDRYGIPTYVVSKDGTGFKSVDLNGVLGFVFFKHKLVPPGTSVIIPHVFEGVEKVVIDMSKVPKNKIVYVAYLTTSECPKHRPHYIIDDGGNKLYVADIFVNYMSKIAGKRSVFTYNLWWVPLHRGRTSPYSLSSLLDNLEKVLENMRYDVDAVAKFVRPFLKVEERGGVFMVYEDPEKSDTFEMTQLPWEILADIMPSAVAKILGVSEIDVCSSSDYEECKEALNLGMSCVLTRDMSFGFRNAFRKFRSFAVARNARLHEMVSESRDVWFENLAPSERVSYLLARGIVAFLSDSALGMVRMPAITVSKMQDNILGVSTDFHIILNRSVLESSVNTVETAIHELAHAVLIQSGKPSEHLTEEFYIMLERFASSLAMNSHLVTSVMRCARSGFPFYTPLSVRLVNDRLEPYFKSTFRMSLVVPSWLRRFFLATLRAPLAMYSSIIVTGFMSVGRDVFYVYSVVPTPFYGFTIKRGIFDKRELSYEIFKDVNNLIMDELKDLKGITYERLSRLAPGSTESSPCVMFVVMYEPPEAEGKEDRYSMWVWEKPFKELPSELSLAEFKLLGYI